MARNCVAVIGFSVLAGKTNVVFGAQKHLGRSDIQLRRIALGAQTPVQASFLIDHFLDQTAPDAVILELATSGYNAHGTPEKLLLALRWMVYACQQRGIGVRFLNFPLQRPPGKDNWVADEIARFATSQGLAVREVPLQPELLRDKVHVNGAGFQTYARIIAEEAQRAVVEPGLGTPIEIAGHGRGFDPISDFMPQAALRQCDRYGLQLPVYDLPEGGRLTLQAREGTGIAGLVLATNTRTGRVRVFSETRDSSVPVTLLKPGSYYEWPLVVLLPWTSREVTLETLPGVPDVTLNKGTIAEGPRLAPVLGVTWRTTPPHPDKRSTLHKPVDLPRSPTMDAP